MIDTCHKHCLGDTTAQRRPDRSRTDGILSRGVCRPGRPPAAQRCSSECTSASQQPAVTVARRRPQSHEAIAGGPHDGISDVTNAGSVSARRSIPMSA